MIKALAEKLDREAMTLIGMNEDDPIIRLKIFQAVSHYYFERIKDNPDDDSADKGHDFKALKARIIQGGKQ